MSKTSDFAPPEEEINWDEDPTPAPSAAIVTDPSVTTGDDLSAEAASGTTDAQPAPEPSLEKVEAEGAKPDLSEDKAVPAAAPKPKTVTKESGFTFKRLGASFDTGAPSTKPSTIATTTAATAAAAPATTEKDDAEAKRLAAEEEKRKRREARFGVVEKPAPKAPKEKPAPAPAAAVPKPAPTKAAPAAAAAKKNVKQAPAAEKRKAELDPAELDKARKRAERFGVKKTEEKVATSGEEEKKVEEVAEKVEGQ
ncbi:hypothetical protein SAICODRAFT_29373 [Saitoella complicata NRRL Y-17804]|nr:uncharacterized protein SAICODRAFT_29373 [Saitoella complicata NRRL Y-17804]ODQ54683.1 hypothetical protein SAICODRAFT_29373 [Saitoella complicata NRRL Y-17804]